MNGTHEDNQQICLRCDGFGNKWGCECLQCGGTGIDKTREPSEPKEAYQPSLSREEWASDNFDGDNNEER